MAHICKYLVIIGRGWAKYLSVVSRAIICWSQRLRQIIIDLRDTDKSWYFVITEFNNCFIIHRVCFLRNIFGKRSDLPFLHKNCDRKKEKSAVSIMHEQNSICSQKQLNNITHEHTIIFRQLFNCRSRGGLSANKKEETFASDDKYLFREFPLSHAISIILQNIVSLFLVTLFLCYAL